MMIINSRYKMFLFICVFLSEHRHNFVQNNIEGIEIITKTKIIYILTLCKKTLSTWYKMSQFVCVCVCRTTNTYVQNNIEGI